MRRLAGFLLPALPSTVLRRTSTRVCSTSALQSNAGIVEGAAQPGSLYLVSTPIGNTADITHRAVSILTSVDIIAAEDTRRTGLLLKDVLSSAKRANHLLSCHEHNVRERTPVLISSLHARKSVALVSDAGTPCISDPGRYLVSAAIAANIPIVPVPGACAALSALVCTGFRLDSFTFVGFLPRSGRARTAAIERVESAPGAVVLYEAPHRLLATLEALSGIEGPERQLCVGRELTKRFEEFRRFPSVSAALTWYEARDTAPRGEFSLVLGPRPPHVATSHLDVFAGRNVDVRGIAVALLTEGVPVKVIAKSISTVANVPKKAVYGYVSQLKRELVGTTEAGKT